MFFGFTTTSGFFIDLGAEYPLTGMCFNSATSFGTSYIPRTVRIEVSTDNKSWTDLGDSDPLNQSFASYVQFKDVRNVRYLRVYLRNSFMGSGTGTSAYLDPKAGLQFYQ